MTTIFLLQFISYLRFTHHLNILVISFHNSFFRCFYPTFIQILLLYKQRKSVINIDNQSNIYYTKHFKDRLYSTFLERKTSINNINYKNFSTFYMHTDPEILLKFYIIIIFLIATIPLYIFLYKDNLNLINHKIYTIMKNPKLLYILIRTEPYKYTEFNEQPFNISTLKNKIVIFINPVLSMINPIHFQKSFNVSRFSDDCLYTVIIKGVFIDGSARMLTHQFTYKFKYEDFKTSLIKYCDYDNLLPMNLSELYGVFYNAVNDMNEEYLLENIDYVSLIFYRINIPEKKILLNINKLNLNKDFVNINRNKKEFSNNFLPLTLNENKYGKKMFSTSNYKSNDELSNKRIFMNENNKIIIYDITPNSTKKEIYDFNDKLIQTVIDEKIDQDTFTRLIDNLKLTIKNEETVIRSESSIKLKTIKPLKRSKKSAFNKNLGSFDLETYLNTRNKNLDDKNRQNGTYEVYALGFSVVNNNIHEPLTKMYYLDYNQNSEDLVLSCINDMLQTKYNKHIFYTHNLGGFDIIFLLKILLVYNFKNDNYYKLKAVFRDKRILKLDISVRLSKSVTNKITLIDSLNLLTDSLDNLSKHFSTTYKKSIFPYKFITDKTLYYKGSTPSIEFYHTPRKDLPQKDYNLIKTESWDIKMETFKYLKNDLVSLLQIMFEFSRFIFNKFDVDVSENLTITSLALNIFLKHHLKDKKIPLINKKNLYKELKEGYFGGLSEVYKPYGEDLYYYDVNSLYPAQALNPMPGHECSYIEDYSGEGLNLKDLFGYFYCKIKTSNDYLGLLPKRHEGLLVYSNGEWEGMYFSPLLQFAQKHNYEIKVIKGYNFNKVYNLFDSYVNQLYKIKCNSSGSIRLITKFLLNSLTGRFGMCLERNVTQIVNQEEYFKILATREIYDEKWLSDSECIVTYSTSISKVLTEQHGLDYIKEMNNINTDPEFETTFNNVSVTISASITGYSSIYMSEIKLLILSLGGKIYYTDTDSLVTNIKLPEDLVSNSELGKFKLEYKIKRGYFITSKTYCLVLDDEYVTEKNKGVVIKAKGVINDKLTEDDFIKLYKGEVIKGLKVKSYKDYEIGYVSIDTQDIDIDGNVFRKREKIYEHDKWVDTKPLHIIINN